MTSAPATTSSRPLTTARVAVAVLLVMLPVLVVAFSPWHAQAFLLFLGVPPALLGLTRSDVASWAAALVTGGFTVVGLAVSGRPVLGAVVVAAALAGVAWSARAGLAGLASLTVAPLLLTVVTPPDLAYSGGPAVTVAGTWATGALVAAGGAWTALVATVLVGALPRRRGTPQTVRASLLYGLVLVPVGAVMTYVAVRWFPGTHAWWAVLTVVVVVQPAFDDTRRRAGARVLGTVLGASAAALVVAVVPWEQAQVVVGAVCALGAGVANLTRPYTEFAALLTLALVLMTGATGSALATAAERVAATVVGTAAVLLVVGAARLVRRLV